MNVMITAIIGGVILAGIVFGGAYWFYIASRPRKQTWNAKVYTLSEGVRPKIVNKHGEIVCDLELNDLRPYAIDIVEKKYKGKGIEVYFLQKLKKTIPPIVNDLVEKWGKFEEVNILLHEENCTLLRKGYDKKSGDMIYNPIPYDRMSMIDNQIAIRDDKFQVKTKDLLTALAPYFLGALVFVALIANGYFLSDMYTKTSADRVAIAEEFTKSSDTVARKLGDIASIVDKEKVKEVLDVTEEDPPTIDKELS